MSRTAAASFLALALAACAGASEDGSIGESAAAVTQAPRVNVTFACTERGATTTSPLEATIEVKGSKLTIKDAAGSAKRKATFDRDYGSHGTPKVRYLIDGSQPAFSDAEFEWNMIMIETAALSTGRGQVTVRLDAGDRSDWRFLQCAAKSAMPEACRASVKEAIGEGSVQASADEILAELEADWLAHPDAETVSYDDCGSSDYFYVTVRKSDCKVLELDSGDSDGECG